MHGKYQPLVNLYKKFENSDLISYRPDYEWESEDLDAEEVDPEQYPGLRLSFAKAEVIVITAPYSQLEEVHIGYIAERDVVALRWLGASPKQLYETYKKLRIPSSYPENLGEKAFYLFKQKFLYKYDKLADDYIMLTQEFVSGYEKQFRLIIGKLLHVYNGGVIDEAFYRGKRWGR